MDEHRERLEKLEEAHTFTERQVDELDGQLQNAFERISRLNRRLDGIEHRLEELKRSGEVDPDDEAEPDAIERPPHSSRPRPND
jgi:uncharacterized coiled-coil protein SlyX